MSDRITNPAQPEIEAVLEQMELLRLKLDSQPPTVDAREWLDRLAGKNADEIAAFLRDNWDSFRSKP